VGVGDGWYSSSLFLWGGGRVWGGFLVVAEAYTGKLDAVDSA